MSGDAMATASELSLPERMASCPPVCPRCKGSRALVELVQDPPSGWPLGDEGWRMMPGVGYFRQPCPLCQGYGTLHPEEYLPSPHPSGWLYRVPPGVPRS